MKKMFFLCALFASVVSSGQVAVNLPSDRPIDPKAAFQVCGTARLDTMPLTTTPTHVLVLDVNNDSIIHSIPIASFVSILSSMIPPTQVPIVRVYTSNATWTKPPGLKYIVVEMVGGGGGGGGCYNYGGGAGAAGGYCKKIISAITLNSNEVITIGLGGNGGIAQFPGVDGGTTSFGSHCYATGGQGGKAQTTLIIATIGSLGGMGVNGDINLAGTNSGGATSSSQPLYCGASSVFGGGASTIPTITYGDGLNAINYGSGGSGGNGYNIPNQQGGSGSNGVVFITEYY